MTRSDTSVFRNWVMGGILACFNAAFDSVSVYLSLATVSPESLENPHVWKAMGLFIVFNVMKTMGHYFKTPPKA